MNLVFNKLIFLSVKTSLILSSKILKGFVEETEKTWWSPVWSILPFHWSRSQGHHFLPVIRNSLVSKHHNVFYSLNLFIQLIREVVVHSLEERITTLFQCMLHSLLHYPNTAVLQAPPFPHSKIQPSWDTILPLTSCYKPRSELTLSAGRYTIHLKLSFHFLYPCLLCLNKPQFLCMLRLTQLLYARYYLSVASFQDFLPGLSFKVTPLWLLWIDYLDMTFHHKQFLTSCRGIPPLLWLYYAHICWFKYFCLPYTQLSSATLGEANLGQGGT